MNQKTYNYKAFISEIICILFIFGVLLFLFSSSVRAEYQYEVCESPQEAVVNVNESHATDSNEIYYPPAGLDIGNDRIIGVRAIWYDNGGDWDYRARVRLVDKETGESSISTNITNACNASPNPRKCTGFTPCIDVCTPNPHNRHDFYIPDWQSNRLSIKELRLATWIDFTDQTILEVVKLRWVYVDCRMETVYDGPEIPQVETYVPDMCLAEGSNLGNIEGVWFQVTQQSDYPRDLKALDYFTLTLESSSLNVSAIQRYTATYMDVNLDSVRVIGNGVDSEDDTSPTTVIGHCCTYEAKDYRLDASWYNNTTIFISELEIKFDDFAYLLGYDNYDNPIHFAVDDWKLTITAWNVEGESGSYTYPFPMTDFPFSLSLNAEETETPGDILVSYEYTTTPGVPVHEAMLYCSDNSDSTPEAFTNCGNKLSFPPGPLTMPNDYGAENYTGAEVVTGGNPTHSFTFNLHVEHLCGDIERDTTLNLTPPLPTGPTWLMTVYGDTFANTGYADIELYDILIDVPKGVVGDDNAAWFSTYIISKNLGSWVNDRSSYNNFTLDGYQDANVDKVGDGKLYDYMYNLYKGNESSCTAQVYEEANGDSLGASCDGNSIYFLENETTLDSGWNQTEDPNRACIIISKSPVRIPSDITGLDAMVMTDAQFITETAGYTEGGGEQVKTFHTDYGFPNRHSIEIGSNGYPLIFYQSTTNNMLRCLNEDCSESESNSFNPPSDIIGAAYSAFTLDNNGKPVIVYYSDNRRDIYILRCADELCSSYADEHFIDDAGDKSSPSLAIGHDGNPVLIYEIGHPSYNLKVVKCRNADCSDLKVTILPRTFGSGLSWITVDTRVNSGFPIIVASNNKQVFLYYCDNKACTTRREIRILQASVTQMFRSVYVTTDNTGIPVVAYFTGQQEGGFWPYRVRVIRCDDLDCSSWTDHIATDNISSMFSRLNFGMDIGPENFPILAFFDEVRDGFYVSKCLSPDCSSYEMHNFEDAAGSGSGISSVPILYGNDGNPIIAYGIDSWLAPENNGLWTLKCANKDCSPPGVGPPIGLDETLQFSGSVISNTLGVTRNTADNKQNPGELFWYNPKYLDIFRDCLGRPYSFKIREYQYISSGN